MDGMHRRVLLIWFLVNCVKGDEQCDGYAHNLQALMVRFRELTTKTTTITNSLLIEINELKKKNEDITEENLKAKVAITKLEKENERITKQLTDLPGSTYVRWGRTECPGNGTEMVYSGYVGQSHYDHSGAAVNYLCLPSDPLWGQYDDSDSGGSYVYGAEYDMSGSTSNKVFNNTDLYNHDVPCAVCRSTRVSSLMIPGRNACYGGWTMEYTGYLVSGYIVNKAATEYICLDKDPETVPGGEADNDGKLLHLTETQCGSLKCPPYVDGRELTCSICTR